MKPLIGINLDISAGPPVQARIRATYYESILAAGGIPLLIPPMPDDVLEVLLPKLGGLLLIGGLDYCPTLYGEEPCETVELTHPERQDFDIRLVQRTIKDMDIPILGICAGCQVLNISLGGSLIQDIAKEIPASEVNHRGNSHSGAICTHTVEIEPASRLAKIYKNLRVDVPTRHHQAVKNIGRGLVAVARAEDGVIEAVESPNHRFLMGVQWHPERDFEGNEPLFREFVTQSAAFSKAI
jgi:putative glutamine amidotransferase